MSVIDEGILNHTPKAYEHEYQHDHEHSQFNNLVDELPSQSDFDDSKCDHMCHFSLHMMGFISQYAELPIVHLAAALSITNESFASLILDPPFQPPQA